MGLFDFWKIKKPVIDERYVDDRGMYNPPGQHMIILMESMELCVKTVNPATFFSREKLAAEKAYYCRYEPDIVWNSMSSADIYEMLEDPAKRDAWHRRFIDRLFEKGKEDELVFHMKDARISQSTADYFVSVLKGKKYHFCKICFSNPNKLYTYVTWDYSVKPGDSVSVTTGSGNASNTEVHQVAEVFDAPLDMLGIPVTSLRCIDNVVFRAAAVEAPQVISVPESVTETEEPEMSDMLSEAEEVKKDVSGTYPWEKFYPLHCDDDVVEMMAQGGIQLVQGSGLDSGDLLSALYEIEKESNRVKILRDLKKDGYHTQEKEILEYFQAEGCGKALVEMIDMFEGTFTKELITEFYIYGVDISFMVLLPKISLGTEFTDHEIITILDSIDNEDVDGIKALLDFYNPKKISKETMIEICELVPVPALSAVRKLLKLLPYDDRQEIEEEYF